MEIPETLRSQSIRYFAAAAGMTGVAGVVLVALAFLLLESGHLDDGVRRTEVLEGFAAFVGLFAFTGVVVASILRRKIREACGTFETWSSRPSAWACWRRRVRRSVFLRPCSS